MDTKTYERLRSLADELPVEPPVWAIEIDEEGITMMTSSVKRHGLITLRLRRQLDAQLLTTYPGVVAHSGPEIESPAIRRMRRPDLLVLPESALDEEDAYADPGDVRLVAEIVSRSNPEIDYAAKTLDCPAMGIPHYVIIDPGKGTAAVLSDPGSSAAGARYRSRHGYVFGETMTVGSRVIDTGQFPTCERP